MHVMVVLQGNYSNMIDCFMRNIYDLKLEPDEEGVTLKLPHSNITYPRCILFKEVWKENITYTLIEYVNVVYITSKALSYNVLDY